MTLNAFLASLPAILAITGFAIYQILRSNVTADPVVKEVLKKLRQRDPHAATRIESLKGKALEDQLKQHGVLRASISQQDFQLLQQTLRHRLIISLVVYGTTTILFLVGVYLFFMTVTRPKPLSMSDWTIQSVQTEAAGRAVDLDDLVVAWKADGRPEDVTLFLENTQTGKRSTEMRTASHQGSLIFSRPDYAACLSDRSVHGRNRIRAVCQAKDAMFQSSDVDLLVGIKVLAFHDVESNAVRIAAMIDNSAIPFYSFNAKVLVWTAGNPPEVMDFGSNAISSVGAFPITQSTAIRWETMKVHYLGPDEPAVVRTKVGLD